jgi:hypothetical protein
MNDSAALAKILADDFTAVSPTGKVGDKATALTDSKTETVEFCQNEVMQVRIYGNAALVVGRTTMRYANFNGLLRFTDTFVQQHAQWRCVASQDSPIDR